VEDIDRVAIFLLPYITWGSLLIIALVFYLTPSVVAFRYKHRHHNAVAILVLNLLLGWTLIGWMVALVWALTKPPPAPR
jgi:hypothetical protein